jgi:hypothetical protein
MILGRRRTKPRRLLDAARQHQDALEAAGLPPRAIESYELALRGLQTQARASAGAARVLVREIQREVEELQAAIRKEFPADAALQAAFKAREPIPAVPREVLALGRHMAGKAPAYARNLAKYAINAATVKHLTALCDQLQAELGGENPAGKARAIEEQIVAVARQAFAGRPELAAFE